VRGTLTETSRNGREGNRVAGAETGALSPVPRTPLYERLVERLRTHVLQADAGDRLPPERELAARLGVSRSSVRQAIVALQVRGLVEVRHGGGTFLRGDDLDPAPSARILDLQRRLPDILDAREALAVKLAELAAERRTDADLQAIHAALAVMADQVEQSTPGEAGDEAFQHCITAAAHSSVLAQMSADLAQDIGASRHESPSHAGRPPASLAQHRAVADAVRDGDAAAAADAMRVHLRSVRDDRLPSGQAPPALLPDKD
jgi:GntR family transcriptional regulator, transcriptional repressor for pyruvate dehydrogenase complex